MENQNQLAQETLIDAAAYIKRLLEAIDDIVDKFLSGREDLALTDYVNFTEGIQWLFNVIQLTKDYVAELGLTIISDEKFVSILNEMIEAFENRDYVLVGDLLNYEIKPIIENWDITFQEIVKRV